MPSAIVYVGLMLGTSFATTAALIGLAVSVVSMAVMSRRALPKMDSPYKAPSAESYNANKQIIRSGAKNRIVGYGKVKVGGLTAMIDTTDIKGWNKEGNSDLYMAIAVFPHPVESFQNLHVNDKDLTWFQNSDNWTDADDVVTIIWHNNMDEFTDPQGHDGPIWWGTINGIEYPPTGYGIQGEAFDLFMNGLGFTVTTSFIDGGTRKHIKRGKQYKSATSTSWAPQYNVDKTEATIPVWNEGASEFDTVTVTLDDKNMVKGLDGSNTWYWYKGTWNGFYYDHEQVTLAGVQVVSGEWKSFSWNGSSYDTITTDYDPSKDTTIDLTGEFSFTNFFSHQVAQTDESLKEMQASIDDMPGVLDVNYYKGSLTQQVDPTLNALFPYWDSSHVGRGVTYFTTHLFYDYEALPNGIPLYNVTLMAKNDLLDPRLLDNREDLSDVVAIRERIGQYTTNLTCVIMDYMISEFGLNIPLASIDMDSFSIAANICDENISLKSAQSAQAGPEYLAPVEGYRTDIHLVDHGYSTGNETQITQGDITITAHVEVIDKDNFKITTGYLSEGFLTSDLRQKRYTINGIVDTSTQPSAVIDSLLLHCGGGSIIYDDGMYKLNVGAYKEPTSDITEDWIISDIKVQPRATRDQLYNAVKGTYVDQQQDFEPTDYKAWENPFYCQEDNKDQPCDQTDYIYSDLSFPYCLEENRARRLAKIHLNRHRQALVVNLTCNLNAYIIDTGDFVTLTVDEMGFILKVFEVISWTLNTDSSIDFVLQETAAEIYDWNEGEYVTKDLAENTLLPSLTWPNQFESIELTTAAYFDTSGSIVEQIIVKVIMGELYDYVTYADTEIEFKDVLDADAEWTVATKGKSLVAAIQDVKMSLYAIRVRGTSKSAPPTQWYYSQIRTQGAGSLITEVLLPKPIDPMVFFSIQDNEISKLAVSVDWKKSEWIDQVAPPEYVVVMYSAEEESNEIQIADDNLVIASAEVLEEGSIPVLDSANNSVNRIKIFNLEDDINTTVDLSGMWWCRVDYAGGGESIFTKVRWYDEEYIYLARDLEVAPSAGDTVRYWTVAFHDTRADEFQLGCIKDEDTDEYEVILWDDLQWDGSKFQFIGVTRGAEETIPLDATGKKFSYYPGPGPGTSLVVIPASSFDAVDDDTLRSVFEVDITLPQSLKWGAMTMMFGRNTVKDNIAVIARSPIVLPRYGGES